MLGISNSLLAQDVCGGSYEYTDNGFKPKAQSCAKNTSTYLDKYRYQATYKPKGHAFIDEVIIPINIIVLCDDNGDYGAYTPTTYNAETQKEFWLNRAYQRTSLPSDPVSGYASSYWLSTTKISFEINQVYFYNSSTYLNADTPDAFINHHFSTAPSAKDYVNCFLVKNVGIAGAGGYQSYHSSGAPITVSVGRKPENMTGEWQGAYWYWADHLPHELGHALGLCHTYSLSPCYESHTGIDYLEDVFFNPPLYEQPCPNNELVAWDSPTDFCTNNLMSGHAENFFVSPLQAGRMHRQLRMGIIRNFAYNYSSLPHNITSNETWDFTYKSYNDIVVKQGATLTIQCRVEMVKEAKIIVEPGAKLIVDGGIITSARSGGSTHEDFWQGIEVWGTTSQNQYPVNNPTYQGYLQLINGGTIENAHNAVTNWKSEDWSKIGGVIVSNGGIFKNNRRDVEFIAYENFDPSNSSIKRNNLSSFTNTNFIADNNVIPNSYPVQPHVTMWGVYGIYFTNCHFSNTRSKPLYGPSYRAIYSTDAGYTVSARCSTLPPLGKPCPTGNLLKSSFSGYQTAIEATGAGTSKTIMISQSDFTNNVASITVSAFNNVSFNRNNISIGTAGYPYAIGGTGVSITNSTGYIVEENNITTSISSGFTVGIYVDNSGTANNRLYKNILTGLAYGNNLTKINRDASNSLKGLQFLCNAYNNNSIAVYVTESTPSHGVRLYQGEYSPLKSAGNTFSNNTNSIYNTSISPISYYHNGGATIPTNNTSNVTPYYTSTSNSCPSSYGGLILLKGTTNEALDSLETTRQNLKEKYNNLNYTYLSLLDDGNTEELKAKIENSWSKDVWKLRGNLLEQSPYLSQEILLETAKLGTLPNAMLLEVCLANPDVTKGAYFISKLDEATNGSFPSYMHSYILNNDEKTTRTQLEGQIAALQSDISTANHFIANITATADEYSYNKTFSTIVSAGNDLSDKVNLMDFFVENKQWTKADSVLKTIYSDKKMQSNVSLVEDFDQYIAFRSSLGERKIAQLNEQEIAFLQTLAENENRVSGYARNILCFFYNICYDNNMEDGTQKMMLQQPTAEEFVPALTEIMYSVNLFPNPANDYSILQWELLDELKDCQYQIFNLNGQMLLKGEITENKGEVVIDTRALRSGIYVALISNNGIIKASKKIEVRKNN